MKASILFFLLIISGVRSMAQQTFSKVFYDSTSSGYAYSITPSFDNGEMVTGTIFNSGLVMKLDSAGSLEWNRLYSAGGYWTRFYSIIQTADSGFMLVGSILDSTNHFDALCMKVNRAGDTLWTRKLGTAADEEGISVAAAPDGGFVIVGYAENQTLSNSKILLFKLDSAGSMVWSQCLAHGISNMGYSVKPTPDSGFVITGNMVDSFPNNRYSAFLVKVNAAGNVSWAKNYYTVGQNTEGLDIAVLPGGYILYLTKYWHSAMMKVDLNGNVDWIHFFPDLVVNRPYSYSIPHARLITTSDGGLAFVNGVSDYNHFGRYYLCKTDTNGINAWGEQLILNALAFHENADKGFSVAGNGPLFQFRTTSIVFPDHFGVFRTDSLWNNSCGTVYGQIAARPDTINSMSISMTSSTAGVLSPVYPVISSTLPLSDSGCVGFALNTREISA